MICISLWRKIYYQTCPLLFCGTMNADSYKKPILAAIVAVTVLAGVVVVIAGCIEPEEKVKRKVEITIEGWRVADSIGNTDAVENHTFFIVEVTVKNMGNRKIDLRIDNFELWYDPGGFAEPPADYVVLEKPLQSGELVPGGNRTGEIAFQIPKDAMGTKLHYQDEYGNDIHLDIPYVEEEEGEGEGEAIIIE